MRDPVRVDEVSDGVYRACCDFCDYRGRPGTKGQARRALVAHERSGRHCVAIRRERAGDWRCECGDLNRDHEAFCFRCGAGPPRRHDDVAA